MNFRAVTRKVGKVWSETNREAAVNNVLDGGIQKAQTVLRAAIQRNTPVRTGETRAKVLARGEQRKRAVVIDLRRAIPLDFGWLPGKGRAELRRVRAAGGKGSRKRARAILAGKVAGKHFFYRTFDALIPALQSQYLAPVGAAVVKALQ